MKRASHFLLVVLLAATCFAQSQDDQTTFKSEVNLVSVYVTVVNQAGAPVGGLTKDNFAITEDGVPQKIAVFSKESELPLSIAVAIDTSLSTRKDIHLELQSARHFIHDILRPQDSVALYQFDAYVDRVQDFTNNLHKVDDAIGSIRVGSATAMFDAIYLSARDLSKRQGRKVLVVITDGDDTYSKVEYSDALRSAQQSEAIVYPIIIMPIAADAGRNTGGEHALIQIAKDTGGKYYYAQSIAQLDEAFKQVSDELRTQYLLGYYPKKRVASSDFRKIDVTLEGDATGKDYAARHRTGYYTSKLE
jgi:Ca-activated chloride channel family protein